MTDLVPHPATGELLDLAGARADALVGLLEETGRLEEQLHAFKGYVAEELARRADARGSRTVELDGVRFEVNAPTEDVYDVARLREELAPLVAAGVIDRELLDELIRRPNPKPPEPKVDKRRLNALLKSDDRRLLAALAAARERIRTRRTVRVIARVSIDGTAEEA